MVMQSGEDPAGGKDSKSAKPLPWKYILIAAILAASILGIFFAATTGIFNSNPTPAASTNPVSGASQPATNPGLVLTDNEDDKKSTTPTAITPSIILGSKGEKITKIDIQNPPEAIGIPTQNSGEVVLYLVNLKVTNDRIEGDFIYTGNSEDYVPILVFYFYKNPSQGKICVGPREYSVAWPEATTTKDYDIFRKPNENFDIYSLPKATTTNKEVHLKLNCWIPPETKYLGIDKGSNWVTGPIYEAAFETMRKK